MILFQNGSHMFCTAFGPRQKSDASYKSSWRGQKANHSQCHNECCEKWGAFHFIQWFVSWFIKTSYLHHNKTGHIHISFWDIFWHRWQASRFLHESCIRWVFVQRSVNFKMSFWYHHFDQNANSSLTPKGHVKINWPLIKYFLLGNEDFSDLSKLALLEWLHVFHRFKGLMSLLNVWCIKFRSNYYLTQYGFSGLRVLLRNLMHQTFLVMLKLNLP